MTRPNILIVDNDEDIVRMLTIFLESRGYACRTCGTGAQGFSEFGSGNVNVIITDLNMPGGDGVTFIKRIRQASEVPIIVVTAFGKEYAARVRSIRGVTVLPKPIDPDGLLDLIEVAVAQSRLVPDAQEAAMPATARRRRP